MHVYTPVFRTVLSRALRATWAHRRLWVFGFLAGVAQSGAVTNDILRMAPKLEPGAFSWQTLEDAWNGFSYGKVLVMGLITGTGPQILLTILSSIVLASLTLTLIVASQHFVLSGTHLSAKKNVYPKFAEIWRALRHMHLWRIFGINLLTWLSTSLAILSGGLLLRALISALPDIRSVLAVGVYLLLLPLAFALSSIGMLAVITIIQKDTNILTGIHHAITFFVRHWLLTIELSALLFIINFFVTAGLGVGLLLFAQIMLTVFSLGISSPAIFAALTIFSMGAVTIGIAVIGGLATLFNYSAWMEFVHLLTKKPAVPRSEHLVAHARRTLRRK